MKLYNPAKVLLFLLLFIFNIESYTYSQCANGAAASSISYDTTFRGGGNTIYDLNFPQFDTSKFYLNFPQFNPSKGTLIKVDIQTIISVKNMYKLENQDNVVSLSRVKIIRADIINSPVLITPFENNKNKTLAVNILGPSDGNTGSGSDYVEGGPIYAYQNYPINYNLTSNLAGFLGNGKVPFKYETQTDLYSSGSNNLFTSITEDSIYFKLTYYYCTTSILPEDISNFTVIKLASGSLQLSWNAPNDNIGNRYEIEKSSDGKNYASIKTITSKPASANYYQVNYTPAKDEKDKLFFRIKQYEADGSFKYSVVKIIQPDYVSTTMKVCPTVTKSNVQIYFPSAAKSDYQVSILNITGQVIQQSAFSRTNLISFPLNSNLKPGLYIVNVVNKQTMERQQSKLVIE